MNLPHPGIEPGSPALQADSLPTELSGKPPLVKKPPAKTGDVRDTIDSLVAQMVKRLPAMRETQVPSLGWEDALEKDMATHSSTLAWKITWMEAPGRLHSVGCPKSWT